MADGHPHLRLLALAVGIDSLSGETAPVPDTDLSPCCVNCASERICCMHVLKKPIFVAVESTPSPRFIYCSFWCPFRTVFNGQRSYHPRKSLIYFSFHARSSCFSTPFSKKETAIALVTESIGIQIKGFCS